MSLSWLEIVDLWKKSRKRRLKMWSAKEVNTPIRKGSFCQNMLRKFRLLEPLLQQKKCFPLLLPTLSSLNCSIPSHTFSAPSSAITLDEEKLFPTVSCVWLSFRRFQSNQRSSFIFLFHLSSFARHLQSKINPFYSSSSFWSSFPSKAVICLKSSDHRQTCKWFSEL